MSSIIKDYLGKCFVSYGYAIVFDWSTQEDQINITYSKFSLPKSKRGKKFLFRRKNGMLFKEIQPA